MRDQWSKMMSGLPYASASQPENASSAISPDSSGVSCCTRLTTPGSWSRSFLISIPSRTALKSSQGVAGASSRGDGDAAAGRARL